MENRDRLKVKNIRCNYNKDFHCEVNAEEKKEQYGMFNCKECGGILLVIEVETPPEELSKQEKLIYNRLCNVQCDNCKRIYYSQPYDYGKPINVVRKL
ncbi:hypothetical protein [Paenibacillus alginolyticus]|uniref:hypothetical protein n=1 Tax=Paenibacillus alginolyticus TaxID=59839 RepID=UPI002DBC175B|nr:hypothetical protein [Paenibacillus alginolyticus]MEC0145272.1 hypothetical protein [Paenibacillus alginolyticus]